jgi:hypothetical protein
VRLGSLCSLAVTLGLLGCSFDAPGSAGPNEPEEETTSTTASGSTSTGGLTSETGDPPPMTSGESGTPVDPDSTGDPTDADTHEPGTTSTGDPAETWCPTPLPEGWILCEDFEDPNAPAEHFSSFDNGNFALVGEGFDSPTALEITHRANQTWSGWATLRFGEGPEAANVVRPDTRFDEVWVRFRFRVEDGWPVQGPGDLVTIAGYTVEGIPAFFTRTSAPPYEPWIYASVRSCVFGEHINCVGDDNDWNQMSPRYSRRGNTAVFEDDAAEVWRCGVMHARLNDYGMPNGVLEVTVDQALDSAADYINYRELRTDIHFNQISLPSFIEQPLQNDHRRYLDNIVVSTEPLHCNDAI